MSRISGGGGRVVNSGLQSPQFEASVEARTAREDHMRSAPRSMIGVTQGMGPEIWDQSGDMRNLLTWWEWGNVTDDARKRALFWSRVYSNFMTLSTDVDLEKVLMLEKVYDKFTMLTALHLETRCWRLLGDTRFNAIKDSIVHDGADWLRCIVGNPFHRRIKKVDLPDHREIQEIARQIYEDGEYEILPILADRLEEEGFDYLPWLQHMRVCKVHTRGCYVLDTILGKCEWL